MANDRQQAERLREIIADGYRTTPAEFARKIGVRPQSLYNVLSGACNLSAKMLDRICTAFPEINRAWVLTGIGARFAETSQAPEAIRRDMEIERLEAIIESQQKTIKELTETIKTLTK